MKTNWNYLDHPFLRWYYPELALCRTQFERMEASTRGRAASPALAARVLFPTILFVVYMLGVPAIYLWARPYWLPMWSMAVVMGPATPIFLVLMMLGVREHARRGIRTYLLDRGIAVCLGCGYDLRGLDLSGNRCPECGDPLSEKARANIAAAQPAATQ